MVKTLAGYASTYSHTDASMIDLEHKLRNITVICRFVCTTGYYRLSLYSMGWKKTLFKHVPANSWKNKGGSREDGSRKPNPIFDNSHPKKSSPPLTD